MILPLSKTKPIGNVCNVVDASGRDVASFLLINDADYIAASCNNIPVMKDAILGFCKLIRFMEKVEFIPWDEVMSRVYSIERTINERLAEKS